MDANGFLFWNRILFINELLMIETPMVRAVWQDKPQFEDITVLICQNKTIDLIRLSLESLLTFYPTIKILVVNGSPQDESGKWLNYKEAHTPNLTVWDRVGYDSHGVAMHEAITGYVTTKYVLLMDSDVIFKRHGAIEEMYREIDTAHSGTPQCFGTVFAVGSLMSVTKKNHACGPPLDENDILRYIHPSLGLYDVGMYKAMDSKFADHGAPCVYPMLEAEKKGFKVIGVDIPSYVMHLSGASWTDPRTVWNEDFGVCLRPLVTFITSSDLKFTDTDYDIIRPKQSKPIRVVKFDNTDKTEINNNLFDIRFNVSGDYVCVTDRQPDVGIVGLLRSTATDIDSDEINLSGFIFWKRSYFQSKKSWE